MHRVITIARQYGSRGREIGRAVAELTGSNFYDNNLITMSAQKTGISSDKLVDADEKIPNSVLYTLATGSSIFANTISPSIQPTVFRSVGSYKIACRTGTVGVRRAVRRLGS